MDIIVEEQCNFVIVPGACKSTLWLLEVYIFYFGPSILILITFQSLISKKWESRQKLKKKKKVLSRSYSGQLQPQNYHDTFMVIGWDGSLIKCKKDHPWIDAKNFHAGTLVTRKVWHKPEEDHAINPVNKHKNKKWQNSRTIILVNLLWLISRRWLENKGCITFG